MSDDVAAQSTEKIGVVVVAYNAASTLTVRLGWRMRQVTLADAEATFDVAKDRDRPFIIAAGDQQIRVVGTEFNVRDYDRSVVVSVRRGVVEVRQPALGDEPVARLTAGEELRHVQGSAVSARGRVDPNAAYAWTTGRLICNDRPLSDIVAYLNRRYPTPILVSQANGARRFSGVLELGDQQLLVRRLAEYLFLPVHRADGKIILG